MISPCTNQCLECVCLDDCRLAREWAQYVADQDNDLYRDAEGNSARKDEVFAWAL